MKPIFRGIVKQGKLKVDNPTQFMIYLANLEGKRFQLLLEKEKHIRSLRQNSFYWGVVVDILAGYCGYTDKEMHEELKRKFNPKPSKIDYNETYGGSTTIMSTVEFEEYLEKIMAWASKEYGIYIPVPGEYFE